MPVCRFMDYNLSSLLARFYYEYCSVMFNLQTGIHINLLATFAMAPNLIQVIPHLFLFVLGLSTCISISALVRVGVGYRISGHLFSSFAAIICRILPSKDWWHFLSNALNALSLSKPVISPSLS